MEFLQSDVPTQSASQNSSRDASQPEQSKAYVNSLINEFPRSHSAKWKSPIPATPELEALSNFKPEHSRQPIDYPAYDGYTIQRPILMVEFHDFEIYRSPHAGPDSRRSELTALHLLAPKRLCVDGLLRMGRVKHYVQGLAIQEISIEGYGDDRSPDVVAYLQTDTARKDSDHDVWYTLKNPSQRYQRFHVPFLWVAQLGKHVIDYLSIQPDRSVELESFRKSFCNWLQLRFNKDIAFQQWHHAFRNQQDFRAGVNAYIVYIYRQAYNLPDSRKLLAHPLWADCLVAGATRIRKQPSVVEYTISTPTVFANFKDMYFGTRLQEMSISPGLALQQKYRKSQLGFATEPLTSTIAQSKNRQLLPYGNSPVRIGDIIAFESDNADRRLWKNADHLWLAYVQRIETLKDGVQRLFVLYLYRPEDTSIFRAKYIYPNEFFFSDNCNCHERELLSTEISGRYDIAWLPHVIPSSKYFIRQTYITQESAFVTLKEEHRTCSCQNDLAARANKYRQGDTVYLMRTYHNREVLEPVIVNDVLENTQEVVVRLLARLRRDYPQLAQQAQRTNIAANELVLTNKSLRTAVSQIQGRCNVYYIQKDDVIEGRIHVPYNRDGAGGFWFFTMGITTTLSNTPRLVFLAQPPRHFSQGPDITVPPAGQKLNGLSVFGGGGNFDRGLEEGGAVEFRTVVDFSAEAIHTQRANARDPSTLKLFYGSADDYLKLLLSGKEHQLIAKIGDVHFIAAGSPCPGFSSLQQDPLSDRSLINASHITTVCTAADIYRPEYGIFENVPNMASTRKGFEGENVLAQLVSCLVSMGYQLYQFTVDSWNHASGQQRSRLFLTIAAPGLEPILPPQHTSSRPLGKTSARSLGKLPNGQRFGEREHYPTPFEALTAGEITSDLPSIGNGNVETCISYPDHRVSTQLGSKGRALLACIPREPPGCGYKEAYELGLIPPSLQKPGKETGKAFRRVPKDGLIPTITTKQSAQDAHNGAVVHWSEDRPITVQEARRAQGYLDDEVIIGRPADQYEIVGNGVDRKVAFSLGLELRDAQMRNCEIAKNAVARSELETEMLVDTAEVEVLQGEFERAEMLVDAEDVMEGCGDVWKKRNALRQKRGDGSTHSGISFSQSSSLTTKRLRDDGTMDLEIRSGKSSTKRARY